MEGGAPRIVFAGGGTGGHVYPALAVAGELRRRHPGADISFVGARRGIENRLVPAAGFRLRTLPLSGFKGVGAAARIRSACGAAWAVLRCIVWMLARRPDLVVGVGGYASGPGVLAARLLGVKTMVMEQNHFPGATNRFLAPRVDAVCVPSEAARRRLGGRGIVTGNPVRPEFGAVGESPSRATPSVLVFGGSRGARSLNRAVVDALPRLASLAEPPAIVHQTGEDDFDSVRGAYEGYRQGMWKVEAFLDDMPQRFAAADLVVCRAGATTLAELAAARRPAVLVPYPHAADDHQRLNAEAVADAGGAVVIADRDLTGETLAGAVAGLVDDRERLRRMGRCAGELAVLDAAERIASVADALMDGREPEAPEGGARVP